MSDPRLRLARLSDAAVLCEIAHAADNHCAAAEVGYAELIRKGRSLVVEEGGRLLGFVACEAFGREVHVWELAVCPERQRAGMGSHLLRAALVDARASGFAALTLTARRDTFWEQALRTGLGFAEVDTASHPRLGKLIRTQVEADGQHGSCVPMIRFLG